MDEEPRGAADRLQLARKLWLARKEGDVCPAWLLGQTLDEAHGLQLALLARHEAEGDALGGFKVGLTSQRSRSALGVSTRAFGTLLAPRIFASGTALRAADIRRPSIEAELCFTVGTRLAGTELAPDEVRAGLARVSAGFELNERRASSAHADFPALVTDSLAQWGIVVGSGTSLASVADLNAVRCTLSCDGETVYAGISRDELDDHLESIRALAALLAPHGRALEPSHRVITGAFARFDVRAGQRFRAVYEGVGEVEVVFT